MSMEIFFLISIVGIVYLIAAVRIVSGILCDMKRQKEEEEWTKKRQEEEQLLRDETERKAKEMFEAKTQAYTKKKRIVHYSERARTSRKPPDYLDGTPARGYDGSGRDPDWWREQP